MRRKVEVKVKEKEDEVQGNGCHHFWVIEEANGPTSHGVCKVCGECKDFSNAMPDFSLLKRNPNPLKLPHMPAVDVDKDSKS